MCQLRITSAQPASSSHPQHQQYLGQRLSRGRGISRNALWSLLITFTPQNSPTRV